MHDAHGSIGLSVDGGQPVVATVTGREGSYAALHVFRCTACGEPGSHGGAPSGDPPPSTSTYRPESSTHAASSPRPSPDDSGSSSTTSTAADESAADPDGGPTSWTLPGPETPASGDPTVREQYRLEGPKPEIRPAEPGVGAPERPTPDGDEHAAGPSGSLVDRGATVLAFTLFLVFGALAVVVHTRLVRPVVRIRRR